MGKELTVTWSSKMPLKMPLKPMKTPKHPIYYRYLLRISTTDIYNSTKEFLPVWHSQIWGCVHRFEKLISRHCSTETQAVPCEGWRGVHCGLWHICRERRDMSCIAILRPERAFTGIQWLAHNSLCRHQFCWACPHFMAHAGLNIRTF